MRIYGKSLILNIVTTITRSASNKLVDQVFPEATTAGVKALENGTAGNGMSWPAKVVVARGGPGTLKRHFRQPFLKLMKPPAVVRPCSPDRSIIPAVA
jgi:hypothetical protein